MIYKFSYNLFGIFIHIVMRITHLKSVCNFIAYFLLNISIAYITLFFYSNFSYFLYIYSFAIYIFITLGLFAYY